MATKRKEKDLPQEPLSAGAKFGIALIGVGLLVAIVLLLNKAPTGGFGGKASEYRLSHFPAWKFDIPLIGKHWVAEFEGCDGSIINSGAQMKQIVTDAVNKANASMVAIIYKEFEHLGVTVLALLSESHVGIHTWPQYGYAATDVFTCGNIAQPQLAIEHMEKMFKANATTSRYTFFHRGGKMPTPDLRVMEELNNEKELVAFIQTPFQKAHIIWTELYGLQFFLEGVSQSAQTDEYVYHEALVTAPLLTHPTTKRVMVMGGGEGATLREMLQFLSVEEATMAELDGDVAKLCKDYMPTWSAGAYDDPRANLVIGNGIEFITKKSKDDYFDVILMDTLDPIDGILSFGLFNVPFYKSMHKKLTKDGILVIQGGQLDEDEEAGMYYFAKMVHDLKTIFPFVTYYTKYVRSFDGFWGFMMACKVDRCGDSPVVNPDAHPSLVDKLVAEKINPQHILRSFDGESNRGQFSIMRETREALAALDFAAGTAIKPPVHKRPEDQKWA